jgi:hypothetical protein
MRSEDRDIVRVVVDRPFGAGATKGPSTLEQRRQSTCTFVILIQRRSSVDVAAVETRHDQPRTNI